MGIFRKVEEAWKKISPLIMSCKVSGIRSVPVILLCAWVILIDTLVGILMDSMGFNDGMA